MDDDAWAEGELALGAVVVAFLFTRYPGCLQDVIFVGGHGAWEALYRVYQFKVIEREICIDFVRIVIYLQLPDPICYLLADLDDCRPFI